MKHKKPYEIITDQLIAELGKGYVPWHKPWSLANGEYPMSVNGHTYNGINALILGLAPYSDARWLTFLKAQSLDGTIRKGEKGYPVVFYKRQTVINKDAPVESDDKELTTKPIWILRYYTVFNVEQCDNLNLPDIDPESLISPEDNVTAEDIIKRMPNSPSISFDGGNRAYYSPSQDSVHMPKKENFNTQDGMYATLFHELTHSTGHSSRLSRKDVEEPSAFGCERYAKEELVAEFGSSFLCHESGVDNNVPQHAAYIQSWYDKLKQNPKLLIIAASQGQKASDYILNKEKDIPL
jgi:antirestriction protein ArdC